MMSFDDTPGKFFFATSSDTPMQMEKVVAWIKAAYFGSWRSEGVIVRSIENSFRFGVFMREDGHTIQVGFARVVSDWTTHSTLLDVVIAPEHRAKGLGKFLVECILKQPCVRDTVCNLRTRDPEFYRRIGFEEVPAMRRIPAK